MATTVFIVIVVFLIANRGGGRGRLQRKQCGRCGGVCPAHANFCGQCGTPFAGADQPSRAATPVRRGRLSAQATRA